MAVNVIGLVVIAVFYLIILIIGIVAGRKSTKSNDAEELFVANRSFGLFVASFTTAATMVGGGYINGTAEAMGRDGMIWAIGPIGYNIGMAIAGIVIAPKVRSMEYSTIFDPFQQKYGNRMGGLLFFPELLGDLFWEAAILGALGTTLSIVLGLDMTMSVIVSACVAVVYTFFGGLYAVAYTDVIQLFFMGIGLVLAIPFAAMNPAVDLSRVQDTWTGHLEPQLIGLYLDTICMLIMGGMPWQALYQRVLACKSPALARNACLLAALISLLLAVPPAAVGVIGSATDWNATEYPGNIPLEYERWTHIFPMVLQYLCPMAVSIVGIGAVSAAVMSSADSCVLATGSVFANNIYKNIFRPKATQREIVWVLRLTIVVVGTVGAVIALTVGSVYGLFILCADLMYVVQFPQLICVLWVKCANTYGSLTGFVIGLFLRVAGGEPFLKIDPWIKYPMHHEEYGQLFPFKTFAMLCSLFAIIGVSYVTERLFTQGTLSKKFDIFRCYSEEKGMEKKGDTEIERKEPLMTNIDPDFFENGHLELRSRNQDKNC
ncbi:high-affinity choline transporter 1-like [Mizuhopecten yessoensis]|uniref:High-affinity choline transporter 1 n=1 Tax=Mizuhopecten yessoensis TaxID=6573 RepID=A0A210QTQ2_MIZYE|nr:high-affinity choline transporter 1-like [Mizuhopecten yessoensis]OWF52133.1 High-affinity choline transporter 1 [Mizuhopecten yessoensis]